MQDPVNTALGKARVSVKLVLIGSERYFGPGICELLEKIDDSGSIQAAAKQMNMSYTKAWKILNRAEKEMNRRLITRMNGGKNGGSSTLTDAGERAVKDFREMEGQLSAFAGELLQARYRTFSPDGQEE